MNLILDFQGSTSTLIPFILDKFDNFFRLVVYKSQKSRPNWMFTTCGA